MMMMMLSAGRGERLRLFDLFLFYLEEKKRRKKKKTFSLVLLP